MWMKARLPPGNGKIPGHNRKFSLLSCKGMSYNQSIRRIFPTEEIGFLLLGSLKLSPCSGRLQLTDATGSIDVVIPGLPSTWNVSGLCEVKDYLVVMEGLPEAEAHFEMPGYESFSCRSIFHSVLETRDLNVAVYVHFNWRDTVSRNFPLHPCKDQKDNFKELEDGTFHLLYVTHKHPVLRKFLGEEVTSNSSSMFAEAVLLPWNLFLSGKTTTSSKDEHKEPMEVFTSKTHLGHVGYKRRRTDVPLSGPMSSGLSGDLTDVDLLNPSRTSSQLLRPCNSSRLEVACLVKSGIDEDNFSLGTLHCTKANVRFSTGAQKVLLEFDAGCFSKYQTLQIGCYYITKHHNEEFFCKISSSDYSCNGKVPATSGTLLWSVSFLLDNADSLCDQFLNDICISNDEFFSGGSPQIELPFQWSFGERPETFSDICVRIPADARHFVLDLREATEGPIKPYMKQGKVSNVPLCGRKPLALTSHSYGPTDTNCLLPEGNLISFNGRVTAVHGLDYNSLDMHLSHETLREVNQSKFFRHLKTSICIHVLVDHRIVKISGTFRKNAYPIGFGRGVTATFHRILESKVQNELLLTSVSFIVINSIMKVDDQCCEECSDLQHASNLYNIASESSVSPGLIYDFFEGLEAKPVQFRCRVVAIHVVVLEKSRKYDGPQFEIHSRLPVDIPLAGFVLDDGSGLCCCWANAERAVALLMLGEMSTKAAGSSYRRLKGTTMEKANSSIQRLTRILKKHGSITVNNYGSLFDSSCEDLAFSVASDDSLSCSDEAVLRFIILNACFATVWNVIGSIMDSNAVAQLEKQLTEKQIAVHSLRNVWATEVHYVDPLVEARTTIHELLNRHSTIMDHGP